MLIGVDQISHPFRAKGICFGQADGVLEVLAKRNGLEICNLYLTLCLLEFHEIELSS